MSAQPADSGRSPRGRYADTRTSALEAAIMDRFENGMRDKHEIAAAIGVPVDRVRMVLSYMAPKETDYWISAAIKGSAALLDRIRTHHPEVFTTELSR